MILKIIKLFAPSGVLAIMYARTDSFVYTFSS